MLFNLDVGAGGFTPPKPALDIVGEIYRIHGPENMRKHKFECSGPDLLSLKRAFRGLKVMKLQQCASPDHKKTALRSQSTSPCSNLEILSQFLPGRSLPFRAEETSA